jgi:hypothetical protein
MPVERRDPAVCNDSNKKEGKGEMTKAPICLQDLRRSLYVKAKAEPTWRFWGLYVHVSKMETLHEASRRRLQIDNVNATSRKLFAQQDLIGVLTAEPVGRVDQRRDNLPLRC